MTRLRLLVKKPLLYYKLRNVIGIIYCPENFRMFSIQIHDTDQIIL